MNKIKEQWKPVVGYEGLYEVSNIGHVRRVERTIVRSDGKVQHLKQRNLTLQKWGYYYVMLKNENGQKRFDVHRLVAMAWVTNPNPDKYTLVNHKDENTYNNCYLNLEWCDHGYNTNYGTATKRISKKLKGQRAHNAMKLIDLSTGIEYPSKVAAYEALGISYRKLDAMCNGELDSYKGIRLRLI